MLRRGGQNEATYKRRPFAAHFFSILDTRTRVFDLWRRDGTDFLVAPYPWNQGNSAKLHRDDHVLANSFGDLFRLDAAHDNPVGRRPARASSLLRTFASLLGLALFFALIWGTIPSFWDAYRIGEYEGEGSLRVPTWPVRGAIAAMSAFGAFAYGYMIWLDWTGQLVNENEAPGALVRLKD